MNFPRFFIRFGLWFGFAVGLSAAEQLDRGAVAFPTASGEVYLGWRLLAKDPADVVFDVYRRETEVSKRKKLTVRPITNSTNFIDTTANGTRWHYEIEARSRSAGTSESCPVLVGEGAVTGGFWRLKLNGDHGAHKVGLADFDGDGKLDYLIKQPDSNIDPSQRGSWRPSDATYKLEAYRSDGTFLWRYDMGWAIESGTWYSPVVAYDVDGDGRAEVYTKAGEGDPREPTGHVKTGPEYLVKLDGLSGAVTARVDWPTRDNIVDDKKGDGKLRYSYYSRNQLGVAYLDGQYPYLLLERGTYTNIKFEAYNPQLRQVWRFEAIDEYWKYRGQGAHGMQILDVDEDGRDEIVFGAAALDDDGTPLWTTGRGHPDVLYAGDLDPTRPGLEVFYGHEWPQDRAGICMVDARTGETLWAHSLPTTHIHSQGMVADIDPDHPGMEGYGGEKAGEGHWLYSAQGELLGEDRMGGLSPRAAWWMDGPIKSLVGRPRPDIPYTWTGELPGRLIAVVDCLGDWREELIVSLDGEVRIYSTTIPATTRRVSLMQDHQYRVGVALQTMGYYYPPIVSGNVLPHLSNSPPVKADLSAAGPR